MIADEQSLRTYDHGTRIQLQVGDDTMTPSRTIVDCNIDQDPIAGLRDSRRSGRRHNDTEKGG